MIFVTSSVSFSPIDYPFADIIQMFWIGIVGIFIWRIRDGVTQKFLCFSQRNIIGTFPHHFTIILMKSGVIPRPTMLVSILWGIILALLVAGNLIIGRI